MIRFIALLAIFVATASGAEAYIDLSGDWRKSPDDWPEYANPEFDDTGWKPMRLPWRVGEGPDSRDVYWLHRTVQLPPDVERSDLALTSGPVVSDGVIEAANAKGELFGFERTAAISTQPATAIAETARAWGQNDDITVVTVRRATA